MKQLFLISTCILLVSSSCVTKKKVQRDLNDFYAQEQRAQKEIVIKEEPVEVVKEEPAIVEEPVEIVKVVKKETKPILVKEEKVVVAEGEDIRKDAYTYFVIIGSFSQKTNALNYKKELLRKGFLPTILESTDTGYFRVSIYNSNDETESRKLIADVRDKYPEHSDIWLLKKI